MSAGNLKHHLQRLSAALLAVMIVASCATEAKGPPAAALREPSRALAEGFTYIRGVRELQNGTVVIADPRERRLAVASFDDVPVTEALAQRGAGPNEWLSAIELFPLSGDSSLQADPISQRWAVFDGTKIVHLVPPDVVNRSGIRLARGADGLGHVYAIREPNFAKAGPVSLGDKDSIAFVRASIETGQLDTVTLLRDAPGTLHTTEVDGELRPMGIARPALAAGEEAIAFPDGWVAVARLEPYRVDWHGPSGERVLGAPLPYTPRRFDAQARREYLGRNRRTIASLQSAPPDRRAILMTRFTEFPEYFPPFLPESMIAGGDGRVYIRRADTADSNLVFYDVVNRAGALEERLSLPRAERIITVSARYVYVVWRDADDQERLRRHPLN